MLVVRKTLWTLADAMQVLLVLILLSLAGIVSNSRSPAGSTKDWPYEAVTASEGCGFHSRLE